MDPEVLRWTGLCTHSALLDSVPGDVDLPADQLDAIAKLTAEKNAAYQHVCRSNLCANPTPQYTSQHPHQAEAMYVTSSGLREMR